MTMRYRYLGACLLMVSTLSLPVTSSAQEQFKLQPQNLSPGTWFGWSVALDSDLAVVGAPLAEATNFPKDIGAAYIYEFDQSGSWTFKQRLQIPQPVANDQFGYDVVIDDQRIVVSAGARDTNGEQSGAVFMYEPAASGDWELVAEIMPDDGVERDLFGHAMALEGDRLVVSAIGEDDGADGSGAAYIFERQTDGTWMQVTRLKLQDPVEKDRFGQAVAMDGDRIAIAASSRNGFTGSVAIFERSPEGVWEQTAELVASDAGSPSYLMGVSIALDGDRLIAGAPDNDPPNLRAGSAYIFEIDDSGEWKETAILRAGDLKAEVGFGYAVAMDGDWAIIGTNIDTRTDRPEGCVYLFQRLEDGTWQEVYRTLASDNTGYVDQFGWSVAIQGQRALVGSFLTGGNGQGAMYVLQNFTATATQADAQLPEEVILHTGYPNPFNPTTTIRFDLPDPGFVLLDVYDMLGRHTRQLANREFAAGSHQVVFDAAGLPTGMYMYRLQANGVTKTGVVTLLR